MATLTALQVLYDTLAVDLRAHIPDVDIRFGWREVSRALKVPFTTVWVPGDESGSFGKELPATKMPISMGPGKESRNLADIDEAFHVMLMGFDPTRPKEEYVQYGCTRSLYDFWRAGLYRVTHGPTQIGQVHLDSARWIQEQNEGRHGSALIITGRVRSPVPDDSYSISAPVKADVDLSLNTTHGTSFEVPVP
jgi:hypothetical protein